MSKSKKRSYQSATRSAQAQQTRRRILAAAKSLFEELGFQKVSVSMLAANAGVSASSIYALFQSKRGLVQALMDEALPPEEFEALVDAGKHEASGQGRLRIAAKMARRIYDRERAVMDIFRGASMLGPELKELELEREERRYARQESAVRQMLEQGLLSSELSLDQARDILWACSGRDLYRMLVIERGWSADFYEEWLADSLIRLLIDRA